MADYAYIENLQGRGNIAISRDVFKQIAYNATNRVKGASVSGKRTRIFDLYNPIQVVFHSDGEVEIKIDVSLSKDCKINEVCSNIQKEVALSLEEMIEHVNTRVIVNVASIK